MSVQVIDEGLYNGWAIYRCQIREGVSPNWLYMAAEGVYGRIHDKAGYSDKLKSLVVSIIGDLGTVDGYRSVVHSFIPLVDVVMSHIDFRVRSEELGVSMLDGACMREVQDELAKLVLFTWVKAELTWLEACENLRYLLWGRIGAYVLHTVIADFAAGIDIVGKVKGRDNIREYISTVTAVVRRDVVNMFDSSIVTSEDWLKGGKFDGLDSAEGYVKVKEFVARGEFPVK